MGTTLPADLGELYRSLSPKGCAAFRRILDAEDPQKAQRNFLPFVQAVWPD
jgi:hypothetical protein